jgi:hypothetical protein
MAQGEQALTQEPDQVPRIDELNFVKCSATEKIADRVDTHSRLSGLKITDGRVAAYLMAVIEMETNEEITKLERGHPLRANK